MSLTEFDEDEFKRICREDGYAEEGLIKKTLENSLEIYFQKKR